MDLRNFDLTGLTPIAGFARNMYRSFVDLPDAEWVAKQSINVHVHGDRCRFVLSPSTYRLYVMVANVLPTTHVEFKWRVVGDGVVHSSQDDLIELRNIQSMKSYQHEVAVPAGSELFLDFHAKSFVSALNIGTCRVQVGFVRLAS